MKGWRGDGGLLGYEKEGDPNKNRNFLKFRCSDSLKAQNEPQRGPLPRVKANATLKMQI